MSSIINADTSDGLKFTSDTSGEIKLQSAGTDTVTVDTSGNVGIGTSSPIHALTINGTTNTNSSVIRLTSNEGSGLSLRSLSSTKNNINVDSGEELSFSVGATDKLTLSSDGSIQQDSDVGNGDGKAAFVIEDGCNTSYEGGLEIRAFAPRIIMVDRSSSTAAINMAMDSNVFRWYESSDANRHTSTGTQRFSYSITGGSAFNTSGTWGTISDQRLKENIVDATPKLDEVKQLQVRNFNLIGEDLKQIGFVAQEIEQVFPNIVDTQVNEEDGTETKYVKTTVLIPILTKALQEAITKIEDLETRIQALENA